MLSNDSTILVQADEEADNSRPLLEAEDDDKPATLPPPPRITRSLLLAVFACCIGSSFLFGYHTGVMNTPDSVIRKWLRESYKRHSDGADMPGSEEIFIWSTAVSIFAIGGMVGGLSSGGFADRFGRRGAMMWNNVLAVFAALLMWATSFLDSYWCLIIGRLLAGVNAGLNSGLAPVYLTEVAPAQWRGAIGSLHQLTITMSILIAQVLGLKWLLGTDSSWPLLFGISAVPALVQCVLLTKVVESPAWTLSIRGNEHQAEKDMWRLRQCDTAAAYEMRLLRNAVSEHQQTQACSRMCTDRHLRWPLIIAVLMMLSQQFSGINTVIYYSSEVFRNAGLSLSSAQLATLGTGGLNVLMTFVSVLLIDRFGRRPLHMTGLGVMLVSSALFVTFKVLQTKEYKWASDLCIVCTIVFVMGFAIGPGSIPWFYVSELFSTSSRGAANAFAISSNWLANFCVGLLFLPWKSIAGDYSMLFFTACLAFFLTFTWRYVPETKNKTVAEVQYMLRYRAVHL